MIDFQRECENLEFKATTYKIGACLGFGARDLEFDDPLLNPLLFQFPNPHSEIRNLKPHRPDKSFLTRILGGTS
jgi:hypothetical protein